MTIRQEIATLLHSTALRPTSTSCARSRMDCGVARVNARAVASRNTSAATSKASNAARL